MAEWRDVPVGAKLLKNVEEAAVTGKHTAALENCFLNDEDNVTRWPMSRAFCSLGGTRTYLFAWEETLAAATNAGQVFTIDRAGNATNRTGTPLSGGKRAIFDQTDEEMLIAAGGRILRLGAAKTEELSPDAPNSTHVAYLDGHVVAVEPYSRRWHHSDVGLPRSWPALDVFSADSRPINVNSLVVTPFRELLIASPQAVEQWEPLTVGTVAFARRFSTGEGVYAPYTLITSTDGTWCINKRKELARFVGQTARVGSEAVQSVLEGIDDWTDAWATHVWISGQKFILLQMPAATNAFGTKGLTLLYDYRRSAWYMLFDLDPEFGRPTRYRAWSYTEIWGRHFIGVPGGVEELMLAPDGGIADYSQVVGSQRMVVRTGHIHDWAYSRVDNFRLHCVRGSAIDPNKPAPAILLRYNRDDEEWSPWVQRDLGATGSRHQVLEFGGMGSAQTWQFEIMCSDPVGVDIGKAQAYVEYLRW